MNLLSLFGLQLILNRLILVIRDLEYAFDLKHLAFVSFLFKVNLQLLTSV